MEIVERHFGVQVTAPQVRQWMQCFGEGDELSHHQNVVIATAIASRNVNPRIARHRHVVVFPLNAKAGAANDLVGIAVGAKTCIGSQIIYHTTNKVGLRKAKTAVANKVGVVLGHSGC